MELKSIVVSIILIGVVISAFFMIYRDQGTTHGVTVDEDWNKSYNKLGEVQSDIKEMGGSIVPSPVGEEKETDVETDIFSFMVKGTWTIMKTTYGGIDIFFGGEDGILKKAEKDYGIPNFVVPAILSVILIYVLFLIISAIVRFKVR